MFSLPPRPPEAALDVPRPKRHRTTLRVLGGAFVALALVAPPCRAQVSGDGFLFHQPRVALTLRGGWDGPAAKGDIYSFSTERLTLGRSDFQGPFIGLDLAVSVQPLSATTDAVRGGTSWKNPYGSALSTTVPSAVSIRYL